MTESNHSNKPSKIKIISLGNAEVGKSCIIKRYCEKRFVSKYLMTIGIDYGVTKVTCRNRTLKVNIFDMAGHQSFYEVRNEFFTDIHGVLLVYDVSDANSLEDLDGWLNEMKEFKSPQNSIDNVVFVVCANKTDKRRAVDGADGLLWADSHGFPHFDVSAKTGQGVNSAFECLFENILQVIDNGGVKSEHRSVLNYTKEQKEIIQSLKNAKDDYSRLGIRSDATAEDINKAFRRLSFLLHPDKSFAPGTEEAFKLIVTARTNLLGSTGAFR